MARETMATLRQRLKTAEAGRHSSDRLAIAAETALTEFKSQVVEVIVRKADEYSACPESIAEVFEELGLDGALGDVVVQFNVTVRVTEPTPQFREAVRTGSADLEVTSFGLTEHLTGDEYLEGQYDSTLDIDDFTVVATVIEKPES